TLEDARLALEPPALGLGDVVVARGEDVEDQAAAVDQQLARRAQSLEPLLVRVEVQERPKGAQDQRDPLAHRRRAEVPEPKLDEIGDARLFGMLTADLDHAGRRR